MEVLKKHWKTILITFCITGLFVVVVALIVHSFTAKPQTVAFVQAEKDLKIKGNKSSKIYHLSGCPNYNDIAEYNIVWFKTHEEAKNAGYRMARNC